MSKVEEQLTEQFYRFEVRGRGRLLYPDPVNLEPPFEPFFEHVLPPQENPDDGRRHTFLSGLLDRLTASAPASRPEDPPEPEEPDWLEDEAGIVEIAVSMPARAPASMEAFEQFLFAVASCRRAMTFEIASDGDAVGVQFAVSPDDAGLVERHIAAYFPEIGVTRRQAPLDGWQAAPFICEFGLEREFMVPLAPKKQSLHSIITTLSSLEPGERGVFQVIFEPSRAPWAESMLRAVTDGDGGPFFANRPELVPLTKQKIARPLYSVVVRLAVSSPDFERADELMREMATALCINSAPGSNALVPLSNDDYDREEHATDLVRRRSRRSGMLLNSDELVSLIHLPSPAVQNTKLIRERAATKGAPASVRGGGLLMGSNAHAGKSCMVSLTPEQRVRHCHIVGASGTGKSTLLSGLIRQDIANGEGLALLDPHGDLVDELLCAIPPERIADVVLIDPSDDEYAVGFNILSAHSDLEKTLLSSDLVSVFARLSTSWGDQMASVLQNAIMAFLESEKGGTLSDLRKFLLDSKYRAEFLKSVGDPEIAYYWHHGFPYLSGGKSVGPIITRLESFLSPKPIRYMVSQAENRVDFADIMDSGKILLVKLSQGLIGRENAYLLGSLLVSKIQQTAMSRQRQHRAARRDFWLYLDEFHNFITPSMSEILEGARKYRIGMTLAHQELRQLKRDPEVESSVFSNCSTRIVFRVGDADARALAEGFSSFAPADLQSLRVGDAICRVERSDCDFNLEIQTPSTLGDSPEARSAATSASRQKYATLRATIEAELLDKLRIVQPQATESGKPKKSKANPESEPSPAEVQQPPGRLPAPPNEPQPDSAGATSTASKKPTRSTQPTDLGRGGAQHKAIQHRLKATGESLGFRAIVEKPILDGQGSVDLVLERGGISIGCEINITSTVDYEVGNAAKCLKAGFAAIAVICPNPERLARLESAIKSSFAPEQSSKIEFHSPDSFIASLQEMTMERPSAPDEPSEVTRRGYKVKRRYVELSDEEIRAREEGALKLLARKMRGKSET